MNTDTNVRIQTADGSNYTGYMWTEPENAKSSVVASGYSNKLSSWFTF